MKIAWRTRGKCWDYRFLALLEGGKNLSMFEELFPEDEAPKTGVNDGVKFLSASHLRYYAAWTSDLTDYWGRPVQQFIIVDTDTPLPDNWHTLLFEKLRPIYDQYYDISFDEGKVLDTQAINVEAQKVANNG